MLSVFLLQLAGGSMLAIGLGRIDDMAWRYLRLVAIVAGATIALTIGLTLAGSSRSERNATITNLAVDAAMFLAVVWIILNARQKERVRSIQRLSAALGGSFAVIAALLMLNSTMTVPPAGIAWPLSIASILGGALLIGSVTAAMLLGHRYLTDTGMTIAPLRRLTALFIAAIVLRTLTVAIALVVGRAILSSYDPSRDWILFFLAIRVAIGLLGTAVFAYMIWDCVRRRSTQSATGILYLTMVFVFIGELTAQYLLRWKGLAV